MTAFEPVFLLLFFWTALGISAPQQPTAAEIVRRSVRNIQTDWAEYSPYSFTERDITVNNGKRNVKTSQVIMIAGSPYYKLIATGGHPLPPAQAADEDRKLRQEMDRRCKETAAQRQQRIAQYQKERDQNEALLKEMAEAFDFTLLGEATMEGRKCFVLAANPRPGYQPRSRETKVLAGMRGKMWVDSEQFQWVRVEAQVFRPVEFGLFIADVQPGTAFTLEEQPVQGNIWLPSHFSNRVKARILVFGRKSLDDESYSDYRRTPDQYASCAR